MDLINHRKFILDANGNPITQSVISVTDASGNSVTGIEDLSYVISLKYLKT